LDTGKSYKAGIFPAALYLFREGQGRRLPRSSLPHLLKPEEIGVELTEGFMMDPEASVSALVFIHQDCTYFSVGEE
jgi:hypothetical protein